MKKKKPKSPRKKPRQEKPISLLKNALSLHDELSGLKKDAKKLTADQKNLQERVQDIEIHLNLLTRLLTTLCIEKFGMRVGVLKRLIKRIEKEAIRDSQILHLESLYNLSTNPEKKEDSSSNSSSKDDPWEDIS